MLGISLLALGVAGCQKKAAEAPEISAPKVTVGHPEMRELVDEDEFTGWLRASETVEVRSRVRGHIKQVHFQDGDMVKKDQLLFELDPDPFQAEIDQCKAQARAFDAQKSAAAKDVARYTELVKSGGATQQQLEKAKADADAYDSQIAAKMEEVKQHELDLKYSRVTAPIAGRIGRALMTQGNLVNAGGSDPLLTTIVAIDPIFAYFNIDERSLQRYQKNTPEASKDQKIKTLREQNVLFHFGLDSDEGFPNEGILDFADNKVDSSTGTIEVRGTVKNDKGRFAPGSRIRVRVPVSLPYKALLVPDTALLTDQTEKYLLVLGKKNVVLRRNVEQGKLLDDGMRVVIPSSKEGEGVSTSDWIITLGLLRARVDYSVDPVDNQGQPIGSSKSEGSGPPAGASQPAEKGGAVDKGGSAEKKGA
jgi:RND family efflux transporter MFP subunit